MKMTGCLLFFCFFHTCYAAIDPIEGSIKAGGFTIKYSEAGSGESYLLAVIRSTGYVIRNAAHMVNLDYADLFNKKVLDFLLLY